MEVVMKEVLKFWLAFILFVALLVAIATPLWMMITTIILRDTFEQWYFVINLLAAGFLVILEFVGIAYVIGESRKKTNKPEHKHTDYEDFQ